MAYLQLNARDTIRVNYDTTSTANLQFFGKGKTDPHFKVYYTDQYGIERDGWANADKLAAAKIPLAATAETLCPQCRIKSIIPGYQHCSRTCANAAAGGFGAGAVIAAPITFYEKSDPKTYIFTNYFYLSFRTLLSLILLRHSNT